MKIDAHQHFWQFDPVRDSWITPEMKIIQRDFLPAELEKILIYNNLDGCIAVQADQSEKETEFLLSLASQYDFIKGIVGWVDLRSSELIHRLEYFKQFKLIKGFRHIVQGEPLGFMLSNEFNDGITLLTRFNYTYDILIYPHQLKDALKLVRKNPEQLFVIDHLAKPRIKKKEFQSWASDIKALAGYTNVFCKLSGMITEANWNKWSKEDCQPYLNHVIECFGTNRVMYGSDWPVCLVAGSYEQQLHLITDFISTFTANEKHLIMGGNATRFYNI